MSWKSRPTKNQNMVVDKKENVLTTAESEFFNACSEYAFIALGNGPKINRILKCISDRMHKNFCHALTSH